MRAAALLVLLSIAGMVLVLTLNEPGEDYSQPPMPWELDDFTRFSVAGTELSIHYLGATRSCYRLSDFLIDETDAEVRVIVIEERYGRSKFCQAEGVFLTVTGDLHAPLGGRLVIDASSGNPIAQRV